MPTFKVSDELDLTIESATLIHGDDEYYYQIAISGPAAIKE